MNLKLNRFSYNTVLFCFIATLSLSQGKTGYFAGGGIMFYSGDLGDKSTTVLSNTQFFNQYITVGISHWLTGRLEGSISYIHGKVSGADSLSSEQNNRTRNLSFESAIDEASLHFEFKAFHRFERRTINPFFVAGISVFHFNPKAQLNGKWYELQPLGTEGQYIQGGSYEKPYKLSQMAVPVGAGFTLQIVRHLRLKAEFCHHILFTDYLDDVSTVYPDLELLSSTPDGGLAVALSGRRLSGKYPSANKPRGNPKYKDAFTTMGLSLIYSPGTMKCPASFKSTRIKKT